MRKLKLELLQVESFVTTGIEPQRRGTVAGHGNVQAQADSGESVCLCQASEGSVCQTWDYEVCGDTHYLDCTFVCTDFAPCQGPGAC
jgi:hypothetical protein